MRSRVHFCRGIVDSLYVKAWPQSQRARELRSGASEPGRECLSVPTRSKGLGVHDLCASF